MPAAALAVAPLVVAACASSPPCECPFFPGVTTVSLPAPRSSGIENVSTDPPCTASFDASDNVVVNSPDARTCRVAVDLTDGARYTFSVEFRTARSTSGNCSCEATSAVDASLPMLVDAGAD